MDWFVNTQRYSLHLLAYDRSLFPLFPSLHLNMLISYNRANRVSDGRFLALPMESVPGECPQQGNDQQQGGLRMKKTLFFLALISLSWTSQSIAQQRIGLGFKGGVSFFTQDASGGVDYADVTMGPNLGGGLVYCLNDYLSLGLNAEFELHRLSVLDQDAGNVNVISVIPTLEFYPTGKHEYLRLEKKVTLWPYLFFGVGYNFNSYDPSPMVERGMSIMGVDYKAEIENTLALNAGLGAEVFLTNNFALLSTVSWKYNDGTGQEVVNGIPVTSGNINGSVLTVACGFRYYFPLSRTESLEEQPPPEDSPPASPEQSSTEGIEAVVIKTSIVYDGPRHSYNFYSHVSEGTRIRILEEKDGWYRFTSEKFRSGWIPKECVSR